MTSLEPSVLRPLADVDLEGRIALVTGASRGIGRAAARALAANGAHVVALARTRGGLEEVDDEIAAATGKRASLIALNLTHGPKVDALGPGLYQRFERLDIAVLGAAMLGPISPLSHIPDTEWSSVLDLNLTANFRLLRTLDPLLRMSTAGRVVALTSTVEQDGKAYWGLHAAAKGGLDALLRCYAAETRNTAIRANLFDPGPVATKLRGKAYPGEDQATLVQPSDVAPTIVRLCDPELQITGQTLRFNADASV